MFSLSTCHFTDPHYERQKHRGETTKKKEVHNQTTFLLTTFLPLPVRRVPRSLTVPLLCDGLQSNRYVRENEGGTSKRTIRNNKSVIVGEGKIAHHRFGDVMKRSCGNCYACERFH